ncbi:hypothetical protein PJM40_0011 [Salmonella phage vB_SenP_UTK0002]|nr:hypothetical protein [Salmonella enterica]UUG68351.1 hypothetical protein B2_gp67 [Shigella phage B2]WDR22414.1 hypothetical protein PJM42_0008 [Salmonella phage vB_SenP_UTK0001]WDR22510.1 hypothetical protein PJM40_0011 [Salmonella phage vB_SenP_UTK0002]
MAVLNGSNNASSIIGAALGGKPAAGAQRPQAEVFINVGINVQMPNEEGEMVDTFLSLPFGLPLDTMNELVIRGNNQQWNEQAAARNELLKALVKMGEALDAGTGTEMPKLSVQLYRRKAQEEHQASNNAMAQILAALS